MKNKISVIFAALIALTVMLPVHAEKGNNEMELTKEIVNAKRKLIVLKNMDLSEAEKEKFLKVYDQYRKERDALDDQRARLIGDFADHYESLTDKKAAELLNKSLDLEEKKIKFQKSYVKKFNAALPAKKVARFYQVEHKMDAIVDYELVDLIPLAQ